MRTSFKRIFRRKGKNKQKNSAAETADDTAGDEVADSSRPSSLFQPHQQQTIQPGNSTSTVQTSQSSIARRNSDQVDSTRNSVATASEIAPIEEEIEAQVKNKLSPGTRVATAKMSSNTESEKDTEAMSPPQEASPPDLANSYESIPFLEQTQLPRGGVSVDTKAVGRVQVRLLVDESVDHAFSIRYTHPIFLILKVWHPSRNDQR
jgi:hypothetical protein